MRTFDFKDKLYLSAIRVNGSLALLSFLMFFLIRYFLSDTLQTQEHLVNLRFDLMIIGSTLLLNTVVVIIFRLFGNRVSFVLFEFWIAIFWSLFLFITLTINLATVKILEKNNLSLLKIFSHIEKDGIFWYIDILKYYWGGEVFLVLLLSFIILAFFCWLIMIKLSVFNSIIRNKSALPISIILGAIFMFWSVQGGRFSLQKFSTDDIPVRGSNLTRLYSANFLAFKGFMYSSSEGFPKLEREVLRKGVKKLFYLDVNKSRSIKSLLSRESANLMGRDFNVVVFFLENFNGHWKKYSNDKFPIVPKYFKNELYLENLHAASDTREGNLSSLILGMPMPSFDWDIWRTDETSFYKQSIARYFQNGNVGTYFLSERNLFDFDKSTKLGKMGFERIVRFQDGYYKSLKFLRKRLPTELNSFWIIEGCKNLESTATARSLTIPKELETRLGSFHDKEYFENYRTCLELTASTIKQLRSENTIFIVMGSQVDHGDYVYGVDELEDRLKLGAWIIPPVDVGLDINPKVYASVFDLIPTVVDVLNTKGRYFSLGKSLFDVKEGNSFHPDFSLGKDGKEKFNYLLQIGSALSQ